MTGLIVLTFIPAVAAIMFGLRARRELGARIAAEARVAELERAAAGRTAGAASAGAAPDTGSSGADAAAAAMVPGHVLGVVSHELRSPISAILGYQELLAEGIFGPIDPRAEEALGRIRHSAVQLLNLTDGIVELAGRTGSRDTPVIEDISLNDIIDESIEHLSSEGAGRGVTIAREPARELPPLRTDRARVRRVLDLILAAAVKASPNAVLDVAGRPDGQGDGCRVDIAGVRLDPARDLPGEPDAAVRTGVALRLAMARRAALSLGARVDFDAAADATFRISLRLPAAPATVA